MSFLGSRRPELDGIRALAVSLVLVGHALSRANLSVTPALDSLLAIVGNAGLGVRIFFVLSGFLITTLLLKEKDLTGSVSLNKFYIRRAKRILPPFLIYIFVIALLKLNTIIIVDWIQIISAAFFAWNYSIFWIELGSPSGSWYLGHFWTLALEEQFYIFWPLLIFFLKPKIQFNAALMFVLLSPLVRVGSYFLFPGLRGNLGMFFHSASDGIFWGALFALTWNMYPGALRSFLFSVRIRLFVVCFVFFISPLLAAIYKGAWMLTLGFTLDSLFSIYLIYSVMTNEVLRKIFAWRPFVVFGLMSYSIYIWQQLFLAPKWAEGVQFSTGVGLILIVLISALSLKFVELPLTRRAASFQIGLKN